jgi:hypothetical protein
MLCLDSFQIFVPYIALQWYDSACMTPDYFCTRLILKKATLQKALKTNHLQKVLVQAVFSCTSR